MECGRRRDVHDVEVPEVPVPDIEFPAGECREGEIKRLVDWSIESVAKK